MDLGGRVKQEARAEEQRPSGVPRVTTLMMQREHGQITAPALSAFPTSLWVMAWSGVPRGH